MIKRPSISNVENKLNHIAIINTVCKTRCGFYFMIQLLYNTFVSNNFHKLYDSSSSIELQFTRIISIIMKQITPVLFVLKLYPETNLGYHNIINLNLKTLYFSCWMFRGYNIPGLNSAPFKDQFKAVLRNLFLILIVL